MKVIKAPNSFSSIDLDHFSKIFLGGSIEMGAAENIFCTGWSRSIKITKTTSNTWINRIEENRSPDEGSG